MIGSVFEVTIARTILGVKKPDASAKQIIFRDANNVANILFPELVFACDALWVGSNLTNKIV